MTFNWKGFVEKTGIGRTKHPDIPMEFFFNLNTAPNSLTREEAHFNQEPLNNVNFERLNEGFNTFISQKEILCCIKKLKNNKTSGEDLKLNE